MNKKKLFWGFILACVNQSAFAVLPSGTKPQPVVLDGDNGGKVAGGGWSSEEIKNKVYVMFYVDPDESTTNDDVTVALKAENFTKDKFGSIVIINMAATWKPNFAIDKVLEGKQKEFPNTIYIKDKNKKLVKDWQFADDSSNIMAFDSEGKVIFSKDGKLGSEDIAALIKAIKVAIN